MSSADGPLAETARRLERASGELATQSLAAMDEHLGWFRGLPADERSSIMLVAQAGIASFVEWLRTSNRPTAVSGDIFGAAPRDLARSVSLQRAVQLVRIVVATVEAQVDRFAAPGEPAALREAILRYSRELAFTTAQVYARFAEDRGAWDARLEALVVDALLRGDDDHGLPSRASALGWASTSPVAVVIGSPPDAEPEAVLGSLQRAARRARLTVLAGVHGAELIVVLGGETDPIAAVRPLLTEFGPGPVVVGPTAPDLASAGRSARAALGGRRAAPGWPTAPRPVHADALLPERALAGDAEARRELIEDVYRRLHQAGPTLVQTVAAYLDCGGSLEATSRALFVHPNTVRYRLRRVAEVCQRSPTDPRGLLTIQVALTLGRLHATAPMPSNPEPMVGNTR
ncbi:MAG: helix-turn-helix domain-containing protein [Actinobacteria bacterium]|nr:helix-turn-helix domain-containing protein [Actinomycetota bacterium]